MKKNVLIRKELTQRIGFFISILIMAGNSIYCQELIETFAPPPPPQASNLGTYIDNPVSLYTGKPEINIPIHTIKTQNLELPISISYSTDNVRIIDFPGEIGFGWTLFAGGTVSSQINGFPDALVFGQVGQRDPTHTWTNLGPNPHTTPPLWVQQAAFNGHDIEPDIFYFNYPGGSGKFVLRNDGSAMLLEQSDIKISFEMGMDYSLPSPGNDFIKWIITDEKGIKYTYGQKHPGDVSKGTNQAMLDQNLFGSKFFTNAWYLRRIESPFGDWIELEYENRHPTTGIRYWESQYFQRTYLINNSFITPLDYSEGTGAATVNIDKRLRRILSSSGELVVLNWTIWEHDPKVVLCTSLTTNQHIVSFHYSLLNNQNQGNRPKLDRLEVNPKYGNTQGYSYSFAYNDNIGLPPRTSFAQDLWGYFNGRLTNSNLLPSIKVRSDQSLLSFDDLSYDITELRRWGYVNNCNVANNTWRINGADRSVNPDYITQGVLREIVFPTGGRRVFEFEPHEFGRIGNRPVRITTTTSEQLCTLIVMDEETSSCHSIAIQSTTEVRFETMMHTNTASINFKEELRPLVQLINQSTGAIVYSKRMPAMETAPSVFMDMQNITLNPGIYRLTLSTFDNGMNAHTTLFHEISNTQRLSLGGGLRIKSIEFHDEGSEPLKYNYHYKDRNSNFGVLTRYPLHAFVVNPNSFNGVICNFNLRVFSNSVTPLESNQLPRVYYTSVQTTIEGKGGLSKASFLNSVFPHLQGIINAPSPPSTSTAFGHFGLPNKYPFSPFLNEYYIPYDWNVPESIIHYVQNENGQTRQVMRETNSYNPLAFSYGGEYVTGLKVSFEVEVCSDGIQSNRYYYKPYFILQSIGTHLEEVVKENFFEGNNDPLLETTKFFRDSPNHNRTTRTFSINSDGNEYITNLYYPADLQNPPLWVVEMTNKNMHQLPLIQQTILAGSNRIINSQIIEYNTFNQFIRPFRVYNNDGSFNTSPLWNQNFNFNTNNHFLKTTISKYDAMGNVSEVIEEGNKYTTIIWGYNYLYPIAVIENANYNSVIIALGNTSIDEMQNMTDNNLLSVFSNLRTELPNALITTYTHIKHVGISRVIDHRGLVTQYFYDNMGRLARIIDHEGKIIEEYQYHYAEPSN